MNVFCPIDKCVCFRGCEAPCKAPEINPLATAVPEEKVPFRGILATVVKVADTVNLETNLDDELKLNLNIKL
ncbi:MAG: hypothetical protein H9535_19730 [Ignavibacteria bacterium]|nr:hypothetical protein [Ignavibacteria bacterium]MBL7990398.1 hypothetical protein [Candidatus Kapabacteria bacterium]